MTNRIEATSERFQITVEQFAKLMLENADFTHGREYEYDFTITDYNLNDCNGDWDLLESKQEGWYGAKVYDDEKFDTRDEVAYLFGYYGGCVTHLHEIIDELNGDSDNVQNVHDLADKIVSVFDYGGEHATHNTELFVVQKTLVPETKHNHKNQKEKGETTMQEIKFPDINSSEGEYVKYGMFFMERIAKLEATYKRENDHAWSEDFEIEELYRLCGHAATLFLTRAADESGYHYFADFVKDYVDVLDHYVTKYFSDDPGAGVSTWLVEKFYADHRGPWIYTRTDLASEWRSLVTKGDLEVGLDAYINNCVSADGTLFKLNRISNKER